jgi:NADPH:quinone reductase-like Zn-dependent oxidoreductase
MSIPVPFTPGRGFAGVVLSVAPDVPSIVPGDRVMAYHALRTIGGLENLVLLKGVIIRGFQMGDLPKNVRVPYADGEEQLGRFVEGGLRPVVDRVVPLEGTADGMAALLDREVTGKVVINPRL